MRLRRSRPVRGLLAGLLALAVFASSALGMAEPGSAVDARVLVRAIPVEATISAVAGELGGPDQSHDGGAHADGHRGDGEHLG